MKCRVVEEIENLMWEYRDKIDACSDEKMCYYFKVKLEALYDLLRRLE